MKDILQSLLVRQVILYEIEDTISLFQFFPKIFYKKEIIWNFKYSLYSFLKWKINSGNF